jgi:hypothetical protein
MISVLPQTAFINRSSGEDMPWVSAAWIATLESISTRASHSRENKGVNDSLAFTVFVAIFCGGLAALTIAMVWIAAVLLRRNRKKL